MNHRAKDISDRLKTFGGDVTAGQVAELVILISAARHFESMEAAVAGAIPRKYRI